MDLSTSGHGGLGGREEIVGREGRTTTSQWAASEGGKSMDTTKSSSEKIDNTTALRAQLVGHPTPMHHDHHH